MPSCIILPGGLVSRAVLLSARVSEVRDCNVISGDKRPGHDKTARIIPRNKTTQQVSRMECHLSILTLSGLKLATNFHFFADLFVNREIFCVSMLRICIVTVHVFFWKPFFKWRMLLVMAKIRQYLKIWFYFTENRRRLYYKDRLVNVIYGNSQCLLWESYQLYGSDYFMTWCDFFLLDKKYFTYCRSCKFIVLLTTVHHLSLSWARLIPRLPYFSTMYFNSTLPSEPGSSM